MGANSKQRNFREEVVLFFFFFFTSGYRVSKNQKINFHSDDDHSFSQNILRCISLREMLLICQMDLPFYGHEEGHEENENISGENFWWV